MGWKRVKGWFKGPKSVTRHVTKGVSDFGRGAYKYVASPQHSFIYGKDKKGWSIGQGIMSGVHNLAYYGDMAIGKTEKSTYGKREIAAENDKLAGEEAAAREAARLAEVERWGAAGAEGKNRRRARGLMSTQYAGSMGLGGGTTTLGS